MARKLPPKSLSSTTLPLRLTYGQRVELSLEVRDACLALARRHGVERVVCDTSVLDATVGGFLIWITTWSHEVAGLDVRCPAMGGAKLLDLLWVVGDEEFEVRTFKRPGEWVPQLLALARDEGRARLH